MLFTLRGHTCPIKCLDSSPNKLYIISGDESGNVNLWSLETRRSVRKATIHDAPILTLKFINNDLILTHGRDNLIKILDLNFQELYKQDVNCLNFCNAGIECSEWPLKLAVPATLSSDYLDIYEISKDFKLKRIFAKIGTGKDGSLMCLQFLNRTTLYAGFESGKIARFQDGALEFETQISKKPVLSILCSDNWVYIGSANKQLVKLDSMTNNDHHYPNNIETIEMPKRGVQTLALSNNVVYAQCWSGDVVPKFGNVKASCICSGEFPELDQLRSARGSYLAVGCSNGCITVFQN